MLGIYENFPGNIHKMAHFTVSVSNKKLQQTIIQTLYKLNKENFNLEDVARHSIFQCTVILEFGIAEENNFNYLDSEEMNKLLKIIHKKPFQIMDFFCAARYYKELSGNKIPLKFDYYMLRFMFNKSIIETRIFHERGPRHISPEDMVNLIVNKINETFSKRVLKTV
ncbi:MAG: hypothetical protein QXH37_06040 [Candidatus Bathyarchaeia archaeon]